MVLTTGTKVRMDGEKQRYTVRASDDRFVIMTKPFNARKTYLYTIADLKRGVRGPCNLIFGSIYDFDTHEGAGKNLEMLQSGEMEVTYRRDKDLTESEIAQLAA